MSLQEELSVKGSRYKRHSAPKPRPDAARPLSSRAKERGDVQVWQWPRWIPYILSAWCVLVAAIYYAVPLSDGDLWWHMAYGKYMLNHGTLIPDHTIYSWTPVKSDHIYCAWISEILLYVLHTIGGLPLLFGIRYGALAVFVLLCYWHAKRFNLHRHPFTWLAILLGLLISQGGIKLKPELFSYVLTLATVGVWFRLKARPHQITVCYLFPVIMLIWVNSHGAFVAGAMLFFFIGLGELLQFVLNRGNAMPVRTIRHLLLAMILSAIAPTVTPYGIDHLVQLCHRFVEFDKKRLVVFEHQSTLSSAGEFFHLIEFFFIGLFLLGILFWLSRPLDVAVLVVNLAFAYFYTRYLRTTHFFAPIITFSLIYLLARAGRLAAPSRRLGAGMLILLSLAALFLGGRAGYESVFRPSWERWLSFDSSFYDPTVETEYIKRFLPPQRIGNIYNVGGYLLWSLYPDYKVLVDQRFFPYEEWIEEEFQFEAGLNFEDLLSTYQCDVFVVQCQFHDLIKNFLRSPEWRSAFYGPTAVVFVRNEILLPEEAADFGNNRFRKLKSPVAAFDVLWFALNTGDYSSAEYILETMQAQLLFKPLKKRISEYQRYYNAVTAFQRGDYPTAIQNLEACRRGDVIWNNSLLVKLRNWHGSRLNKKGQWDAAYEQARLALRVDPNDLYALFNAGLLGWWKETIEEEQGAAEKSRLQSLKEEQQTPWDEYLKKFLLLHGENPDVPGQVFDIASGVLQGTYKNKPLTISPKTHKGIPLLAVGPAEQKREKREEAPRPVPSSGF